MQFLAEDTLQAALPVAGETLCEDSREVFQQHGLVFPEV